MKPNGVLHRNASCPCGSRQDYGICCQPCHDGMPAMTPQALMRSRFSAFFLRQIDYLLQTWHPSTRPAQLDLGEGPQWTALEVLSFDQQGGKGQVHFRAIYKSGSGWGYLEEESDFIKEAGRWYYLAGTTREREFKPGRNDRCPCGSGRKFKACCL